MPDIRIALIGSGAIGRAHLQGRPRRGVAICAIADPSPAARAIADEFGRSRTTTH